MGSKLCIDKHVSNIEDILEMNPTSFSKFKIEESIPDYVTQHIKIWRYYNDDSEPNSIKSTPISLKDILNTSFNFVSNECYLVLFVYKKQSEETSPLFAFPHSMWGVIESYTNLTPRGLEAPVASSESISNLSKEVLESFLLPRRTPAREDNKFEYMLFVWNGKTANPLMKAMALSAALEFDAMISKGKDPFLQFLFSGGYVRNKKLWMGKVLQLDSSVTKQNDADFEKRFDPVKETVYLMKFLFPSAERGLKPKGFKERFLKSRRTEGRQDDEYLLMGDGMEEEEQEEFEEEEPQEEEREHEEYNENEYEPDQDAEELTDDISPGESPASLFGHAGHEYEDFPPLESSRRGAGHPVMPKLTLSIMKNHDAEEDNARQRGIGNLGNIGNIGHANNAAAAGGDSKVKKMIPNLKLGIKLEAAQQNLNLNGGRAAESYEKSEEDRPPASSDRTSESQDSRRRSERRKANNVTSNNNRGQIANLALGNLGQKKPLVMNYEDLRRQSQDDMYDAKESDIKRCKKEYYSEQCSELLEKFLYVAGETIAYNEKKLKEYGITHIVNAAGDACESKFADKLKYLTYYIKDSRSENIECVFYEAAAFIESARQQGGRVLVHCVQGVSRSVALCMAYLILKHQFTFGKAYEHVRNIREIASPNPAFWAQLYNFQIRLYGPFEAIPSPRVFVIGSYQRETPQTLVARLLFETGNLFNAKSPKMLDPRTVVVLQSKDSLFLWIGNEILPANQERYIAKAEEQIKLLQQYEQASQDYSVVHCGEEPREFWSLWEHEPQNKYGRNKDWDLWLVDLASHKNVVGTTIYEEQDEDEPVAAYPRPGLYCYPELEPLKSIDLEELIDENLLILCTQKDDTKVAYVWRGTNVPPEVEDQAYLANVLRQRWPETDPGAITIVNEIPNNESESFVDYFQ